MIRKSLLAPSIVLSLILAPVTALGDGDGETVPSSDDYVTWDAGPCTEPVLMVETDRDNVRAQIPRHYPGTDEEFMDHLVTTVGADGSPKATVVFTLNRCRHSEVTRTVNGQDVSMHAGSDVTEVLVMVLWDGESPNQFEFYALASYVDDPALAGGFTSIGLPTQMTPNLEYELAADPDHPEPGATVPLHVEIPGVLRAEGSVVRPASYGPAGHATHHYHGPRGETWVEHDAPTGGISTAQATITVTGPQGEWLADLLGGTTVRTAGMYLEKETGHGHTAYLLP